MGHLTDTREIEVKLSVNRMEIERLVRLFASLGNAKISDQYFDSADFRLTKKDIWLRCRNGVFEMKVGSHSNSRDSNMRDYEEVRDVSRIALVLGIKPESLSIVGLISAGYPVFCTCLTSRSKWKNGVFTVDVDDSSFADYPEFSFPVVEVEVEAESPEKGEELVKKLFQERAVDFRPLPFGKICEFLRVNKPEHFYALVDAGVIKINPAEELKRLMKKEDSEPGEHGMTM